MAPPSENVTVMIDGKPVALRANANLFDALAECGRPLPNVVYHRYIPQFMDDLLCLVEVEGERRLMPAMRVKVQDGLTVKTTSPLIENTRLLQLEKLLQHHHGDCYAPCQLECPTNMDVMRYINLAKEKRWDEACLMLYETNPFPLCCGYVCPATCETKCRRQSVDTPIQIRLIKRYLADKFVNYPPEFFQKYFMPSEELLKKGKKIAVIGAGPCGVTAAFFLRRFGHDVTVFEGLPEPGGMLRYGIPEFRYPKKQLKKEMDVVWSLGVKLECNMRLSQDFTVEDLKKQGFDRVFVATGASLAANLPVTGVRDVKKGLYNGVDFLRKVMMSEPYGKSFKDSGELGDFCLVVGGGSVSFDVARSAMRCGAKRVVVSCILSARDMPAHKEEIEEFKAEGGEVWVLTGPNKFVVDDEGNLKGVEYIRYTHFDNFTGEGRIEDSKFMLHPDSVISAIGQRVDTVPMGEFPVNLVGRASTDYKNGNFMVKKGVFAGGDCVFELPMTAVACVNHGKRAAWQIHHDLQGCSPDCKGCEFPTGISGYLHSRGDCHEMCDNPWSSFEKLPRQVSSSPCAKERAKSWIEVEGGLTEEQVIEECGRCLRCGCQDAESCELKAAATWAKMDQPAHKGKMHQIRLDKTNKFFIRDLGKCIGCMRCVRVCRDLRNIGATMVGEGEDRVVTYIKNVDTRLQGKERGSRVRIGNACESCGACLDVCPTNALYNTEIENPPAAVLPGDAEKPIHTTCPYCGVGCGLNITVKNGKIVRVEGDPTHPVSKGQLCVKGRYGFKYVGDDRRLTHPLIKKNGVFVKASWDEALDLCAKRFLEVREKYGGDALGGFASAKVSNEDNYVFQKMVRTCFKTNNVDHCARLCHASTVAGLAAAFGSGVMTNDINGLEFSDVILVTGSNTTESHPIAGLKVKDAVVKHGAKLIVIDPRAIDLTRFATIQAVQKPGTDVIVFNAIMAEIIRNKWHNTEFIEKRTEGFKEFEETTLKYTPEKAAARSGVPAAMIRQIADIYSHAKRASIIFCMGITQHTTGVDNVKSLANMALLCGQIGRASTGVNPLRGQNNVQGACDLGSLCNVYPGYQKVHLDAVHEKFEKAWGTKLDNKIGLPLTKMINAAYDGKIKAMYHMGENPVITDPNCDHAKAALEKLEFFVCQDIFLTPTAELAHVVLPAKALPEKDPCTQTSTERRVQLCRPTAEAPGVSREDWDITGEIARRMGYAMPQYKNAEEIQDEVASVSPGYAGIHHNRLEPHGLPWPCPNDEHPGTPFMYKEKFNRPNGLALFHAVEFIEPKEIPDEEYPLAMTTGRMIYHYHSGTMSRKTKPLENYAGTYVELSQEDGEKYGIKSGDTVVVETRRGKLVIPALVPSRIAAPGIAWLPFHFEEAPANRLTNDVFDPIASIPEYKACACRVRPLNEFERASFTIRMKPVIETPGISVPEATC